MALRAKKPIVKKARLQVLLYGDKGCGKTHFCTSIPNTYYIDNEGLENYPKLIKQLENGGGDLVRLNEIEEIIREVQELLSVKHQYKTLVIDSISFPIAWLGNLEAERLAKKTKGSEGTEFGANLAKAKRLVFQLGILLTRLDMNVIVVSHEKQKFIDNKDAGKTFDVSDKIAYALGAVWNLRLQGKTRKLFVEKSRYSEMETGSIIDFDDGYETVKKHFGESIFTEQSMPATLATKEQVTEFKELSEFLNIPEESIQKWLITANAQSLEDMEKEKIQACIDKLKKRIPHKEAA